jgi:hypothetical protein
MLDALSKQGFTPGSGGHIEGDLARLYPCTRVVAPVPEPPRREPASAWDKLMDSGSGVLPDPVEIPVLAKVARAALDNDLVQQEAALLAELWGTETQEVKFLRYLPRLFAHGMADGLCYNVVGQAEGCVTLADVMRAYPAGLDYRDAAWMIKRVFAGIGYAHEIGIVHGALVPTHILVHPTGHGAKLIDWCYGVRRRDNMSIRAYVAAYKDWYPPEVFDKAWPTAATDIYMIGRCFQEVVGKGAPGEVQDFLTVCAAPKRGDRPQSAWALHDEFDAILHKLVGKPRYRPLSMPGT